MRIANLPDPLVPPNCKVSEYPMPFDANGPLNCEPRGVSFDDALYASWIRLLAKAWRETPASSLPGSDRALKKLSGLLEEEWTSHKSTLLAGWTRCSDGLLYEPYLAKHALTLWEAKQRFSARKHSGSESDTWRRLRIAVFQRDNFTCRYCGDKPLHLECDHVIPRSRGGSDNLSNLVASCRPCNSLKSNKIYFEADSP